MQSKKRSLSLLTQGQLSLIHTQYNPNVIQLIYPSQSQNVLQRFGHDKTLLGTSYCNIQ